VRDLVGGALRNPDRQRDSLRGRRPSAAGHDSGSVAAGCPLSADSTAKPAPRARDPDVDSLDSRADPVYTRGAQRRWLEGRAHEGRRSHRRQESAAPGHEQLLLARASISFWQTADQPAELAGRAWARDRACGGAGRGEYGAAAASDAGSSARSCDAVGARACSGRDANSNAGGCERSGPQSAAGDRAQRQGGSRGRRGYHDEGRDAGGHLTAERSAC